MIKRTVIFFCGFLFCALAYAAPPSDILLSYDLDAGTVVVQGHHPTQDRFVHYIRRVVVTQNQEEPKTFYFTRQDSNGEFKHSVSLQLKAGDKIHVQAFCSQGGSGEADLVIPEAKKDDAKAIDLKILKDQDHKNSQVIP